MCAKMNRNPRAIILATQDLKDFRPAPVVAYFSARGPGGLTEGILKVQDFITIFRLNEGGEMQF